MIITILLTILKITLTIFAILLLLIVFILMLTMFLPIRYRLFVDKSDTLYAVAKASWLLKLIQIIYIIDDKTSRTDIKILAITIKNFGDKNTINDNTKQPLDMESSSAETSEASPGEASMPPPAGSNNGPESKTTAKKKIDADKKPGSDKKIKKRWFLKTKRPKETKKSISKFWETLKNFNNYEHKNEVLSQTYKFLKRSLKALLDFKVTQADLRLGTGTPHITAYIIGIIYMTAGSENLCVRGDYQNTVFEGRIGLRGKLFLYKLVFSVIMFIFNKSIWPLVKKYKRG